MFNTLKMLNKYFMGDNTPIFKAYAGKEIRRGQAGNSSIKWVIGTAYRA